ncbi:MATE family efflux transporter [Crenobacter sp. SG2305]|uniref:MATE family efflux transporter n=1 Tax=Crenobacter oryzisoli TaxID=3056844 RepID=UPI0025AB59B8|nr:MATE family efflux transporter [Crenobacter sp. SG2305]MDN0083228.1 MATE family efflux transporter [Crenobacter sp. SG2305]
MSKPTATPGLFRLTWPILIETLLHVGTGTVSTLMVSRLSDQAVGALGVANQLLGMAITLFQVVAIGSVVVVGQRLGAGDRAAVQRAATVALAINALLGLVVGLVLAGMAPSLLAWMNLPTAMQPEAGLYLRVVGAGIVTEALMLSLSAILRAHGHARDGMVVTFGVNVLVMLGNALLIFGLAGLPKLGVLGAALSTLGGRAAGLIALYWLFRRRLGFAPSRRYIESDWRNHLARILAIGLPAAGEMLSWSGMFALVTSFTARLGHTALVAQSYALQIVWLMVTFVQALGAATEIITAHLVGAGNLNEAYRQLLRSLRLGLGVTLLLAGLVTIGGRTFIGWFSQDGEVIDLAGHVLALSLLLETGRVFNMIVIGALRAAGDARFPFHMGLVSMWGIAVPLAWLFGLKLGWGLVGIWLALAADEWIRGLTMLARWRSRAWVGKALVHGQG